LTSELLVFLKTSVALIFKKEIKLALILNNIESLTKCGAIVSLYFYCETYFDVKEVGHSFQQIEEKV
jgi:hypothetical protein